VGGGWGKPPFNRKLRKTKTQAAECENHMKPKATEREPQDRETVRQVHKCLPRVLGGKKPNFLKTNMETALSNLSFSIEVQ